LVALPTCPNLPRAAERLTKKLLESYPFLAADWGVDADADADDDEGTETLRQNRRPAVVR